MQCAASNAYVCSTWSASATLAASPGRITKRARTSRTSRRSSAVWRSGASDAGFELADGLVRERVPHRLDPVEEFVAGVLGEEVVDSLFGAVRRVR